MRCGALALAAPLLLLLLLAAATAGAALCEFVDAAGNRYDLSALTKSGSGYYAAMDSNSQEYDINICAPVAGCSTFASAAVCQKDSHGNLHDAGNAPGAFSQGTANVGTGFSVVYAGGESCGAVSRSFTVLFVCDRTAGIGRPMTVSESPTCTYRSTWPTAYACASPLAVQNASTPTVPAASSRNITLRGTLNWGPASSLAVTVFVSGVETRAARVISSIGTALVVETPTLSLDVTATLPVVITSSTYFSYPVKANVTFVVAPRILSVSPSSVSSSVSTNITVVGSSSFGPTSALAVSADSGPAPFAVLSEGSVLVLTQPPSPGSITQTVTRTVSVRSDYTGSTTTLVLTVYPVPAIASASLAANGLVTVTFTAPTDRAGAAFAPIPCARVFANTNLGDAAQCTWSSAAAVVLALGYGATLVPGGTLTLRAGSVHSTDALAFNVTGSVALLGPNVAPTPVAQIAGPRVVSSCASLSLASASSGGAGRALTLAWSVSAASGTTPAQLAAYVAATTTPTLLVNASLLALGDFTFALTATNYLGVASAPATLSVRVQRGVVPVVTAAQSTYTVGGTDALTIYTSVAFPPCATPSAVSFAWTQLPGGAAVVANLAPLGPNLQLQPSTMPAGTYQFRVTASVPSGSSFADVNVVVVARTPVPYITGGARLVTSSAGATLSAAQTVNPNPLSALTLSWLCTPSCGGALGATFSLPTGLASGTYNVSLTATSGGLSATASTALTVVSFAVPAISIVSYTPLVPVGAYARIVASRVDGAAYTWTCASGNLDLSASGVLATPLSASTPSLVINPGQLQPATTYVFTLTATALGQSATASVSITTLALPGGGQCALDRSSGVALSSNFTVSCVGWSSESVPISYGVLMRTAAGGALQSLRAPQPFATATFSLPAGAITVVVRVMDAAGSYVDVSLSATVSAPPASGVLALVDSAQGALLEAVQLGSASQVAALAVTAASLLDALGAAPSTATAAATLRATLLSAVLATNVSSTSVTELTQRAEALRSILSTPAQLSRATAAQAAAYIASLVGSASFSSLAYSADLAGALLSAISNLLQTTGDARAVHARDSSSSYASSVDTLNAQQLASMTCGESGLSLVEGNISVASFYQFANTYNGMRLNGSGGSASFPAGLFGTSTGCVGVKFHTFAQSPYASSAATPICSSVVSLSLTDASIDTNSLPSNVVVRFHVNSTALPAGQSPACVWWTGSGWSRTGCTVVSAASFASGTLECSCSHLTDFAVSYGVPDSDASIAWIAGVVASVVAVLVVVLAVVLSRRKRRSQPRVSPVVELTAAAVVQPPPVRQLTPVVPETVDAAVNTTPRDEHEAIAQSI